MKYLTVKEYAELIGKSDKSVYKMIDKEKLFVKKGAKKMKVAVDEQCIKLLDRLRRDMDALHDEIASLKEKNAPADEKAPGKTGTVAVIRPPRKKPLKTGAKKSPVKKRAVAKTATKKKK